MRNWVDNTGNFHIKAKLAVILEGQVRLFKENGRYCTFPMRRLSDADRAYVEAHIVQHGIGEIGKVAVR